MYLIDAHGSDHGLSISVCRGEVEIRKWGELSGPDENGSYSPHIQIAVVSLAEVLDKDAKHNRCANGRDFESMHSRVIHYALNYLSYWGGETEYVDDDDRPCQHFGSYWGKGEDIKIRAKNLKCGECGALPDE